MKLRQRTTQLERSRMFGSAMRLMLLSPGKTPSILTLILSVAAGNGPFWRRQRGVYCLPARSNLGLAHPPSFRGQQDWTGSCPIMVLIQSGLHLFPFRSLERHFLQGGCFRPHQIEVRLFRVDSCFQVLHDSATTEKSSGCAAKARHTDIPIY